MLRFGVDCNNHTTNSFFIQHSFICYWNIVSYSTWQIHYFVLKPQKVGHPAKLPDALLKSCFYILNSNLYPTPEDYRAAFLINADMIHQTVPQFFPELRLFSGQTAGCPSKTVSLHITNPNFPLQHLYRSLNPVLSKPLLQPYSKTSISLTQFHDIQTGYSTLPHIGVDIFSRSLFWSRIRR